MGVWGESSYRATKYVCRLPVASVNLPKPQADYAAKWLISTLEQACYKQKQQPGVVHINVPFAEPLYNAQEQEIDGHPWLMPIQRWLSQPKNWVDHQPLQQEVLMHENWDTGVRNVV